MAGPDSLRKGATRVSTTGTIFDIKKFAVHDGPGIRTTVFLKGCPLDCWWCHNPESRNPLPEPRHARASGEPARDRESKIGCEVDVPTVMSEIVKDRIFYDRSGGGVTLSGGEPLMQIDFVEALLGACRRQGIHAVVDTSGQARPEHFERIVKLVDLFLYDLKLIDDAQHKSFTGVSNRLIKENFRLLVESGARVVVRIPLIPGITDTETHLAATVMFLKPFEHIRRVDLLPYNRLGEDKIDRYRLDRPHRHWDAPPRAAVESHRRWFELQGFETRIGG